MQDHGGPIGNRIAPRPDWLARRPHHLARDVLKDGTYVRVGSTNRRADEQLIADMVRSARSKAFDEQPLPDLDSEAIDFRAASESFASLRALTKKDLETLRLVTKHQGRKVPTAGGILLFATDREREFPDAGIQAGRFDGTDKSRILDQSAIHSLPLQAVEDAIAFVQKHAFHGATIGTVKRSDTWNVPPVAIGKLSSTPSPTPTTHSEERRFGFRSSTTVSKPRTPGCSRSA
jgi:ATP-dependent DNA helicase RecG